MCSSDLEPFSEGTQSVAAGKRPIQIGTHRPLRQRLNVKQVDLPALVRLAMGRAGAAALGMSRPRPWRVGQSCEIWYRGLQIAPVAGASRRTPYVAAVASVLIAMPASPSVHPRGFSPLLRSSLALVAAGTLLLSGCSATKEAAKNAAAGAGEAVKTAATGAAQQALGPAVTPVLDQIGRAHV